MGPVSRNQLKQDPRLFDRRASCVFGWFPKSKLVALIAMLLSGLVMTNLSRAQALSEYQIKAAFLFNFAKFIDWPAAAFPDEGAPLILGVLGADPFGADLEQTVTGKIVNNRPLVIKRFVNLQSLERCHILFISDSERSHLSQIFATLKQENVLTVSEIDQFIALGGMIHVLTVDNRIRFEINQSAAEHVGLKISSKLLSLAVVVKTDG